MANLYRDVNRNSVPGVTFPVLELECDEPMVRLQDGDLRSGSRAMCGRINVNPSSALWCDGAALELVQIALYASSPARPGQNPQGDTFQELGVTEINLHAPPPRRRADPSYYASCIQFGSRMPFPKSDMTIVPFVVRIPVAMCPIGGTRQFTLIAKAIFERGGPPRSSSPSNFEVSSNPTIIPVSHGK